MFIGGFYSLDIETMLKTQQTVENADECKEKYGFRLMCDVENNYNQKIYTNNGRTASVYAFNHCREKMKGKKVLLPDYLCLSVISALKAAEAEYDFYHINKDLTIDIDSMEKAITQDTGMIYFIHYFSVPQPKAVTDKIKVLAKTHSLLIMEDITQALFSRDKERMGFGDYIVGSTRKWYPMTDGGIVAVRNGLDGKSLPLMQPYDESVYKELLISSLRTYYDTHPDAMKQLYLDREAEANAGRYKDLTPREMTDESKYIFFGTDTAGLMARRCENYSYLYDRLKSLPEITIASSEQAGNGEYVPFGFTLLAKDRKDRDRMYGYLVDNGIIPEIQWKLPVEYYAPGKAAMELSERNLMIQCDQRYCIRDMAYVCEKVEEYCRTKKRLRPEAESRFSRSRW